MRIFLAILFACTLLTSCATQGPATKLEKANVLPLSIDDRYEFRKQKLDYYQPNDPNAAAPVLSEVVQFERMRRNFGAVNNDDRNERMGNYFTFFWRTSERSDVTVRLEYRQASLGNYVMAQERYYPEARGSFKSEFSVIGDEYWENGKVTAWRVLLIVDGRIVAVKQSFIWR